jgi:DNA topoisomerase-1
MRERRLELSRVLVVSEKPTAAKRIAEALDERESPREVKIGKVSYYECTRGEDTIFVVYALGHLYELRQTEPGWTYPRFETEWVPKYEVDEKAIGTKPIIALIKRLSRQSNRFVVATDYDIEGSLIGYLALKYACEINPVYAQRMIFSTLTKLDLQEAYQNVRPNLDFPMIESGCVRHEVDWLYGINLTRALTLAIKKSAGWFKIVSTGRVQGPTLTLVASRDQEINLFVPTPFWEITTEGSYRNHQLELEYHQRHIDTKAKAYAVAEELQGKIACVDSINNRYITQSAPAPFNLGDLQAEAYRFFGFRPSRTLSIAQKLYLDALISYPRTNSQRLPSNLDVKAILTGLGEITRFGPLVKRLLQQAHLTPTQGEKDDPAHPAIHPTGARPTRELMPSEEKVFHLVVYRFLASFGEAVAKEIVRADIMCGEHLFYLRGLRILKSGWMDFYGPFAAVRETLLPVLSKGDEIQLTLVKVDEKFTSPPSRFNPASLLRLLEKENLGTKATRSDIIDSLNSRGYTLGERYELSALGSAVYESLQRYVPSILSADFTRELEGKMDGIQQGTGRREDVLSEAKAELLRLLETVRFQEDTIGQALVRGLQRYWREEQEVGPCPKCIDGTLIIVRSPKTGKRFIGCSNYRKGSCDLAFPLPQKGRIVPLDSVCPHCGYRMIKMLSGRRTWETCINWTSCPGRQNDLKALAERKATREKIKSGDDDE